MSARSFTARWTAEAGAWGPDEREAYEAHLRALCAPFAPAVVTVEVDELPHPGRLEIGVGPFYAPQPMRATLKVLAYGAVLGDGADERMRALVRALGDFDRRQSDAPAVVTEFELFERDEPSFVRAGRNIGTSLGIIGLMDRPELSLVVAFSGAQARRSVA